MKHHLAASIAAFALGLVLAAPASSQLPAGVFAGEPNAALAPAGAYAVDPDHTAVIAKVSHIGYAYSVFRFDKVKGALSWDPAHPEASRLNVTVDVGSISTPVAGFAAELTGDGYLKAKTFPNATFVSTGFRPTGPSHGKVDGQFTLMGHTHPLTFDVDLAGAGKGFMGHPRLGVEATARINPADYGMSPMFSAPILLVIDAEFART